MMVPSRRSHKIMVRFGQLIKLSSGLCHHMYRRLQATSMLKKSRRSAKQDHGKSQTETRLIAVHMNYI